MPFLLSIRKKYDEKPEGMQEIKIPLRNEIRSRARIITDEAFRETRNYLNGETDILSKNNITFIIPKTNINIIENELLYNKTNEIREILNKISNENYITLSEGILKMNYDQYLLDNLKVIL